MTLGATLELVVTSWKRVAEDVVELELSRPDGGALPPWSPGAHIDLVPAPGTVRQYSLCGDPATADRYRVAVLRQVDGRGGSRLVHDVVVAGSAITVSEPRNHFALDTAPGYVFVAGGIGITPMLPMIRHAVASGTPWRLHYGGRSLATMAYLDELGQLDPTGSAVEIVPQDRSGPLDLDRILATVPPGHLVYGCGPTGLLDALEQRVAATSLRVERFAPRTDVDYGPDLGFDVRLHSTGQQLRVEPGCSLLDVLRDAGADVLASCEEGTCGTCETPVLEGVPDHRDSLLTDAERAACDRMMVCVSRARTDLLVLDL